MPKLTEAGKKALDSLVDETARGGRLPGFVLAVSNVDEELYVKGSGRHNDDEPNSREAGPDSVFWVCSLTKLITAIAALQLVEQARLSFDTPVSEYFSEFENIVIPQDSETGPNNASFKPAKKIMTIYHLFTHTSGLSYFLGPSRPAHAQVPPYTVEYDPEKKYEQFFDVLKAQGKYPGIPLAFEPGSDFAYGYSSDVLGFVVEKISGLSLDEYSKKNIFEPLGLENTFHLTADLKERLINLHLRNEDGSVEEWKDRLPIIPQYPKTANLQLGGVGSYSTLPDYLALLRHILQIEAGRNPPNALLKVDTVKGIFKPQLSSSAAGSLNLMVQMIDPISKNLNWSTALAVATRDFEGTRRKAGSGWAGNWYFMDPKAGVALVFGSQVVPPMDAVTREIADRAEEIVYANLEG
ncbi:beta-lactamase [Coprinopsis sp. MPI-PUGE-AT-0042]|nr:beta-lactamase [Coprinopsis sp. MPI-PUGE-AT-0042]